jgi:kynurenine formamidase
MSSQEAPSSSLGVLSTTSTLPPTNPAAVLCFESGAHELIDLSYPLDSSTIFWPGGEGFSLCMQAGTDEDGLFYAAGVLSCAEHGGTHVDAPFHFAADGATVDMIPIGSLIAPCRVIDVSGNSDEASLADYALTDADILTHEAQHGQLLPGSIVVLRFGWWRRYTRGAKEYLGYDELLDGPYNSATSTLRFPGISPAASTLLVARHVAGVGLDTGKLTATTSRHRVIPPPNVNFVPVPAYTCL